MALFRGAAAALGLMAVLAGSAGARPVPPIPGEAASSPGFITVCVDGNPWLDGGFEATDSVTLANPNYVTTSTYFGIGPSTPNGTPLCDIANSSCQDGSLAPPASNSPRTGSAWAWFGGNNFHVDVPEIDSAEQTVTFPSFASSVELTFYLRIGFVTSPFTDTLEVQVDGVTQQTYGEPSTAETTYTKRIVDLTKFADGAAHAVKFLYTQNDPTVSDPVNKANFDVDDVTLDIVCSPVTPAELSVDPIAAGGNGVLEPGETAVVAPGYSNSSASAVPLTGAASNFTGPAGPTYAPPVDATADYGSIPSNTTKDCYGQTLDCYSMTAPNPVSRPVAHWDAKFDEALSTGGSKTWTLHIGDSFTDVPTSHMFYSFIETIFHNSITSGCGTGIYCPGNDVTRAEMAVFLLRGEHGSGYAPPACTGPGIFTDVECTPTAAFAVDFIQQLYAEGITSGCGTAPLRYCPDDNVTRAQMAVLLLRAEHGTGYTPPACTGIFADVECTPTPAFAVDFIEQLYSEGITSGCQLSPKLYCPNAPATRGEMAVFLKRTFGLLLYGP